MKINWKLRLKNKGTLSLLIAAAVAFVYQILSILGVTPGISENQVISVAGIALNAIFAMGIVIDPTTKGLSDSEKAMEYKEPN